VNAFISSGVENCSWNGRIDHPGLDAVHADPIDRHLFRETLGERRHAAFGRRIVSRAEAAAIARRDGTDVDHDSRFAVHHRFRNRTAAKICALQVEVHDLVPAFLGEVQDPEPLDKRAGVVDKNVNRTERLFRGRDQRGALGRETDVEL